MLRSSLAALLALAIAVPAAADWSEIVGTGGPTSGRLRWAAASAPGHVWVLVRSSAPTSWLYRLESDATLTDQSSDVFGSGDDFQYAINAIDASSIAVGGHNENGINDRAAVATSASASPSWTAADINGSSFGATWHYSSGDVTHNSRDVWVQVTDSLASGGAFWRGGTGLPTDDFEVIATSGIEGDEGCGAFDGSGTLWGVNIRTDQRLRLSEMTASGAATANVAPTGWLSSGDTIQLGQCFMIGTRFVVVADNVTDGQVYVAIITTGPTVAHSQFIAGDVVGGATLDGAGYIMSSDGTLYSSDGTTTFADASDDFSGGTPLVLSLNTSSDAILVWDADGDVSERIFPPSATTGAASSITGTTATLNGTVNPNGLATTGSFDYGLTTSYGSSASAGSLGSGTSNVAATADITGLTCGTTYHFRATATNADGTTNGSDATFDTSACASGGGVKPAITFRAVGFEPGGFKPEGFTP